MQVVSEQEFGAQDFNMEFRKWSEAQGTFACPFDPMFASSETVLPSRELQDAKKDETKP
jgi:hypothetical protein